MVGVGDGPKVGVKEGCDVGIVGLVAWMTGAGGAMLPDLKPELNWEVRSK
jgi:hypothetical protein